MISCTLQGRTGNQLFQIAATYAHAKRNGFEYCIPPTSINETLWPSHRYSNVNYGKMKGTPYHEPHFHYAEIPNEDNLLLTGYFQSAKYFDDYYIELRDLFGFPDFTMNKGTCCLHIRRGDYIQYKDQFNLLPLEWYMNAIEEMGDKEFWVFSDDKNYIAQKFGGKKNFRLMSNGHPLDAIRMGSTCENHIISASSFSWWMAYMGSNHGQKVIAPNTWFGPKNQHHQTQDLYLPEWIRL